MGDTWWSEHPDLEGVARRGRSEIEQEAVSAESDVELLRQRRRTLVDVCFEWMSRGDQVTVAVGKDRFEGQLTAAVNDLLVLKTRTIEVSINTAAVRYVRSDHPSAFDGTNGDRTVSSFRAQLGRFEIDGVPVHLVGDSVDLSARVTASTEDHLLVRDGQGIEWALPRSQLAYATAPSSG